MKTLSFVPINIGSEWSGRDGLIVIAMRSPGAKQAQHNNEKDWHAGLRKNMGGFVTGFMLLFFPLGAGGAASRRMACDSIVLLRCPAQNVRERAEQLRRAVAEEKFPVSGEALAVSMSVGAVAWQVCETGPVLESILSCADAALYRAKNGGRNRVVIGDPTVVNGIA